MWLSHIYLSTRAFIHLRMMHFLFWPSWHSFVLWYIICVWCFTQQGFVTAYVYQFTHSALNLGCSSTQFQCTNGQCISASSRCTGTRTCSDGSDEMNCRKFPIHKKKYVSIEVPFGSLNATLHQLLHMHSLMLKWRLSVQQFSMCSLLWPLWWDSGLHWWQRWVCMS